MTLTVLPLTRTLRALSGGLLLVAVASGAALADPYPFEGTWIRADRMCVAHASLVRTYTAKDVTSSRSRCVIKRVAGSGPSFELLEECRPKDRFSNVTETIRMQGSDAMVLKRQVVRLKIPRGIRFTRCTAAAPTPPAHPAH